MTRPERSGHCARHGVAVYDDQCGQCDDENPMVERVFRGSLMFPQDYITENGELPAEEFWGEIEREINHFLKYIRPSKYMGDSYFIEWE